MKDLYSEKIRLLIKFRPVQFGKYTKIFKPPDNLYQILVPPELKF